MNQAPLTLKRWRRVEYDRLVDLISVERLRAPAAVTLLGVPVAPVAVAALLP
jgi:hypothetical protein